MRTLIAETPYHIENQTFNTIMYKTWVLICSIGLLLSFRWLPSAMPKPIIHAAATFALIACGELVLNNPTVTPAGPYCPGSSVSISFTGTNLPEGEDIQVFWDSNSGYNPFSGGGSQIGTIPIDYTCTTCPSLLGLMSDPCSGSSDEQDHEFLMMSSGCGFNMANLLVDFDANNNVGGALNSDIGLANNCQFMTPSAAWISQLQSSTNCGSLIIAAGPTSNIPGGAIVIVLTDTGDPTVLFNFDALCLNGQEIYIIQSTCERSTGAFTNNPGTPRTYGVTVGGCSDQLTYTFDASYSVNATTQSGWRFEDGSFVVVNSCTLPPFSSVNYPDIPIATATLNYTIPAGICGSGTGLLNYYVSGMIDRPAPCQNILYTPPSSLALSISCPVTINPAGPFCASGNPVQLTVTGSMGPGSWSGGPYISSTGVFDPSMANIGDNTVTYTEGLCSPANATIVVLAGPVIDDCAFCFITSQTNCDGDSSGNIVNLSSVTGGTPPYISDWDFEGTPFNDTFPDDGNDYYLHGLNGLVTGDYYFIVTDATGCKDTVIVNVPQGPPIAAEFQIDTILCFGQMTGGIQIVTLDSLNPPVPPIYDWDNLGTMGNDVYGSPEPQDLIGILGAGSYALTITYEDPGFWSCSFDTTFTITEPPQLTVAVPSVALPCFGNTTSITATPTGGTAPYSYNWSHFNSPPEPATVTVGLGTYIVTVTDFNGCTNSAIAMITQPAAALMATATGETIACNDGTGDINLTVSGGTTPYTFLWSNSAMTEDLTGLFAGTYTVTVTDLNGCTTTAQAVIDVAPPTFIPPLDDGSTVPCISDAQVVPTPPMVNNSCGAPLTITGPVIGADPICSGTKTYTFTYTDPVTGNSAPWVYTYTITPPTFTPPLDGGSTVACIIDAQVTPTPPMVTNSCGDPVTPTGPVVGADPICSGTKTYTFTYTDCSGTSTPWVYTYTISPPTFTLPASGGATVACIINAQVIPTPPPVNNSCGTPLVITGPVAGADPVCSGTKTYTFTYTDCTGASAQWDFIYTVSLPTTTLPANGGSMVACISDAQVIPTPPNVDDSCGSSITPTGPVVGADPVCSGTKTYTWTYTDCTGMSQQWVYTYTVTPPTFSMPGPGSATVPCIVDAQVVPAPPAVVNSCGATITPTGPVVGADPVCSGTKTYTWTYTDCTGTSSPWVFTYTVSPPTFTVPVNGGSTVPCIIDAQTVPPPPTVMNSCGATITPTGPVVGADPICSGNKTYTWTYTDCTGTSLPWVYTYMISAPTFMVPADGGSTVACIIDAQVVPAPPTVTNSCGDPVVPTGPVVGADPVCSGTKTYTWTYTDCTGTSLPWIYTYTVSPPTFTPPVDGGSTVACIIDAQTVPTPPSVTNSCGDPVTPTGPVVGADPMCSGTKTYTFTYTDCSGTSTPWVFTYTISPPTFSLPAAGGSTVACIVDAQIVPMPPAVNNSCGTPLVITGPVVGADPVCSGTKTYTWTYTDCTGSSGQWDYVYTITPPTSSLPGNGSATVACISDAQVVPMPPAVNNSCGDPLSITGPVIGADPVCSGTKTYTWTYTNCTGATAQWIFTYTVTPPTATMPANGSSIVACISDAQVVPVPPVVNNSCGDPLTITGPVVGADPACSGPKTYTWTYTNCTGASSPWVFTYNISPPTFSLPGAGSSTVPCISDAQVVPIPPVVNNSCGTPLTITGPVIGADPVCSGDKTFTFTYTDCTGSSGQWVYTYTVSPSTFTVPSPGGSTVACISDAQVVPSPPVVTNSCGDPVIPTGPVVGADPVCSGTKTYTWTYTDCSGVAIPWVFTYTINPPTFTIPGPGNSTVACISDAQVVPAPPVVSNSCGAAITPTGPVVSADPVCSGDKTFTWTYTDCTGSSQQWIYTYTISPPTFTLPAPGASMVPCIIDAQVVPTPPAANNSCGDPLTFTGPVVGADPVCSGNKTYTWTYTDCTGSSGQWVYTYTINSPIANLPADGSATVACISDAQVVPTPPAATNSCGDPLTITGPVVSADPICSGTKTYTWTYTDCTGSSAPWVFTYTITPPTFTLPGPGSSIVACITDAQVVPTPPSATNSCGDPLTVIGPVISADPVCSGAKTYTWTYTDCTGSSSPWIYTYTITPPTFSLPASGSSTVVCISDAQVVPAPPVVTNSCGDPVTPTGPVVSADPVCSGDKTYTWTYTDCTGSSGQWVYTYTVLPSTFTVPGPGSSTVACISDAQVVPTPPTVINSCGDPVIPTGPVVGADPFCSGSKTYTWTYTDCSGMAILWVYTYTIDPPTFTLPGPGSTSVACISDAQVVPTPPAATNSCGDPLTLTGPVIGADPACSGDKTYTWTYTDCTGSSQPWVYTYTITPPTFTLPAPGASIVPCIIDAQVVPTPPAATNSCGDPLTITGPLVSADPVCSGDKTYTWTYTDCTGSSGQWVYTYTINAPVSNLPADGSLTVPCIVDAQVIPTPPAATNSCGDPLTITGPVVSADPVCSGTKTYTWTYTDCTGSSLPWVFTYTIDPPTSSLPGPGSSIVSCISDAQVVPAPPVVNNSCGDPLTITGPVVGADPVCSGTKTYTWTYTDCTGSSNPWVYTYTISPPTFTLPGPGSSTVPCLIDAQIVPAPPAVTNSCGATITPTGPVIGADPICAGTKTYTWTYSDCTGTSLDWVYTYTVLPTTFTLPGNGSSTVACISDAQIVPSPPVINDSCGDPVTPSGPVIGADPICSGTKTYTWTYTDCSGGTSDWVYTYTISPPTFSIPGPGGSTVACISDAQTVPAPPSVNNSCGDPVVPTGPVVGADPVCSGTKTYTWTYTDCTGTSSAWVYTYTISPPTFSLPAPGSSTVACISDAQVVPTPPSVNNSCGDPIIPSGPVVGSDPVCSGDKTYTWTYTDCTGTSSPWVYTYTVTPPTVSVPADGGSIVACISDAQIVPTPPVVNNSCGDPLSIAGPVVGADPVCSGTKTYTWTFTDCTGSSTPWVFTYTISPPTFTLPAAGSSTVACISDAQTVPAPPSVTNSCGDPIIPTGPVVGSDPVCSGTKIYTWTYTDCSGASADWIFTYTINPPTYTLPAAGGSTVPCIIDAQVVPAPPSVNNSCGDLIVPVGPVVGADPVCSGTKTYTWTYTDCSGTSMDWIYTYTILPTTFTLPGNGTSTVACISDAQVVPSPPGVNDSCGDPVTPSGPVIGADPVCSGTKTYTWTYTDCIGATSDWVYTYTITPPTFTIPAPGGSTVACISDAQTVPAPPAVTNSCGDAILPTGPVVGADPVCSGTKTYTWTYTDCTGTSNQWVYTYTISPPTFSLPAAGSSTVACVADAQVVPTPPAVSNSCGDPIIPTGPVVSADPICSGTKTYTWTYTDCTGTSGQWVYTYNVSPPTATLPGSGGSTVACIADAQIVPTPPSVDDSCGDPLSITGPVIGADPICSGDKTYTWTYTDCTGASGQWVYTYTITPPTFTLPGDGGSTVACISDAQVVPSPPAVTNSCGDLIIPTGPVVGADPLCSGSKTYTWTYTDCSGTSSQWVYTYTISAPTFTLPADGSSTVPCVSDAQVVPAPPSVTNSCGDLLVPTGPVVGADPVCSGTKTYTWNYTDCTGTSGQWVYTYTITPNTFTLPANGGSTVACIIDAQTLPTPPAVMNSCGDPVLPTGPVVGADPVCSGTKIYTWTYTDCVGNSIPWVFTYTISPPTFTLPVAGGSTVACISDAQVQPTPPPANNSCGDPLVITGPVVGADPVCSGTKTYTWTYTDCTGTSGQWIYTYTISPPTFTLPADGGTTVACVSDAQVVPTPPSVNNSCGDPVTPTGPVVGADPVCSGIKTYTWTYTDCTGTSGQWVFTYTVSPPSSTLPGNGGSTVACISDAQVIPTPPSVDDSCGDPLSVSGPVIGADPICSGIKTYTWTFTDCTGASAPWVYTYTITPPTFTLPAAGSSIVACIIDAQTVPTPPVVNNSCGDPIVPAGPVVGADPLCSGTKTYTWTYTDCTGTSNQWVYTYTISPPTFTIPANGGSTVPCVSDAQIVPAPPSVSNSCGDPIVPAGPVVGTDPVCSGTKTYTWTYTDCTGTSVQWVYTYTITPNTFTLPANGGSTVACIIDAQTIPTPPTIMNSCGDPVLPTGPVVGVDPVCSGTKTYTWTYTDCIGNSNPWVYTYTISPPTFTLPAPGSSTVACISDAQIVPSPPSVINSCGDPIVTTGPVVGADPVCSGTKTYTWTYTDCSGTSEQWVYTYTISPPTFSLPADGGSTVACISDAQVIPTPPPAINSCGDPVTITGPVISADPVCSGTKTYTWTYTDCTGTSGQWVYTYTIDPPTFTLPADDGSTVACVSDAQTIPTPPSAVNSCGSTLTVTGPVVGADPICSGTKTYTWTYTDCTGASAQWVYTYTITPPSVTLPADDGSTVACVSNAQVVPTPPVVNNSCGDALSITGPVVSADPICSGTKTYTWTYTDCTGASGQWVYTYTITPPSFSLPGDAGSTVACIADAQIIPTAPGVDNTCGDPLTLTGPVVGADPVCSGTKTYTWTFTDCTGASGQWVYTYTISAPTFTLPPDGGSNVACVSDAQVVPSPPTVSNSCGELLIATGPVVGADPVCAGTKTYTWTYTDCTGSSLPWIYTYTIAPNTFSLPPDGGSTVACIIDAQVIPTPPVVTNSCGDLVLPGAPVISADPVCSGTKTYTWTYTDCVGNSIPWIYTYTINPPTFTLPPDDGSTVACISDAQTAPTPPVVTNSCGDPVLPAGPVVGADPVCSGTKTFTWTYTDCSGTSVQWVYTYTITPPTFSLPPDGGSTVSCVSEAQVVPTPPSVNNSCGDALTITGPDIGIDPICSGLKTYTWTYTDCTGASADWIYTYTITPSAFSLPPDGGSTVACISNAQVTPSPPAAVNSCGDPLTLTGPVVGADPVCSGIKTYTWTYTDCTGSSAQWIYTYTILPPTISLPPDGGSTVACISDAQVTPSPPTVTNSCGDLLSISSPVIGSDPVCIGTKTYTWTYTDCTGATADWVYTYTIAPPTFTLPPNDGSTVACISDAQIAPTPPSVVNTCGDLIVPTGPVVGSDPVCTGTKTYTWTYTDCDGTSTDWVYTYTITGDTGPIFTAPPADIVVDCVLDVPAMIDLTYTNNCSAGGSVTGTDSPISGTCPATIIRTWTVTDACGNVGSTSQSITINDTTPPTASNPPSIVVAGCNAPVPAPDVLEVSDAADNCGIPTVAFIIDVTSLVGCTETTTRTYSVTDACNNSIVVSQIITRTVDNTPPVFNPIPTDLTVDCIAQVPPMADLNYTDNCSPGGTVSGTQTGPSGNPLTIVRTWTITDACGNPATVSQTITITEISSSTNLIENICTGDVYILPDGMPTSTGGFYGPYTFAGPNGCDSIVTVDLTVHMPSTGNETYNGCQADGYSVVVGGTVYNESNPTGSEILSNSFGCDSTVTINLSFAPTSTGTELYSGCQGDGYSVTVGGTIYNESNPSGTEMLTNALGCDSTVTINLMFAPTSTGSELYSGCAGDGYEVTVNGTIYNQSNPTGSEMLINSVGCDSIVTINLFFAPLGTGSEIYNGCEGDGYEVIVNGTTYNEGNPTGMETFSGPNGCDSTVTINLTFSPALQGQENYNGCEGDGYSVTVNGTIYNEANPTGVEIIPGMGTCDSIVTINLQFAPIVPADITNVGPVCTNAGIITLIAIPAGGTWSGAVNNNQFDPALLGTGTHQVIYTISAGSCQSADTINIDVYELILSCQALTEESAPGANDATGQVSVSGGIPPYTIFWTGPVSGSIVLNADGDFIITSLTAGVYNIEVEDATGCTAVCQFTIVSNIPCDLTIVDISIQDATCPGVNNGAISIMATSTMMPLEYSLDGITYQSSNVFGSLSAGPYTVFVRDAMGCVEMQNIVIGAGQGPQLSVVEIIDASCGTNNGSVEVMATGGTSPYNYSINGMTYGLSSLFPGLNAGSYLVYIIDDGGCTDTIPVTVGATGAPIINSITITDASCGQSNGSITINASGGLGVFMYSINGGTSFQASPVFNNLPSGSYAIVVRDEANCQTTGVATIQDVGGPMLGPITITPTSCGQNDGVISISASGTPLLQYSINGTTYQTSSLFQNVAAGTYTVYVRDGNGCITTAIVTVNTTNGPIINSNPFTHTSCGDSDGTIQINASGGTGTLEYFLNGTSYGSQNFITGLPADTYIIEVEDDNGCIATSLVTINPSEGPDFDVYYTLAHCGQADGAVELDGFDGTSPYMYSINGGPFSGNFVFVNLASDFYTVAIKDANGCIHEEDILLQELPPPTISQVIVTDPDCGLLNGTIQVVAFGSSLQYSIQLPFYQSSPIFNPVSPGTYTVTVRDMFGCTTTASAVVSPKPLPVVSVVVVDSECGMSSGSITVNASGGITPYMYSLNGAPFVSGNFFGGLPAGNYIVTVKGGNDCEVTTDVTIMAIGSQFGTFADAFCVGDDYLFHGNIYNAPGVYSITLPGGASNGCDSIIQLTLSPLPLIPQLLLDTICEGEIYTHNGVDYDAPGTYVLDTLIAASGCDTLLTLNLTVNPLEVTYLDTSICIGEMVSIGGIDYTMTGDYVIDTLSAAVGCDSIRILRLVVNDLNTTTIVESICQGEVYTINGVDYNLAGVYLIDTIPGGLGCDSVRFLDLSVNPLPQANAGADQTLDCQIQSVILNGSATGGNPLWIGPGINAGNETQLMPSVILPGTYVLTVTSAQNCVDTDTVIISVDPSSVIANAGLDDSLSCIVTSITLQASPVGPNYSYQWTGPGINANNENDPNPVITDGGIYTLVVTDNVTQCVSLPDVVVITDISVIIIAIIQNPDNLDCFSTTIDLDATGSSSGPNIIYLWYDDEGNPIGQSPILNVQQGGMFTFVVMDTVSGCFEDDTVTVQDLIAYPPVDAGNQTQIDCNNPTVWLNQGGTGVLPNVIYQWSGPTGGILTPPNVLSVQVGLPGTYYLMAIDTITTCDNVDSVLVVDMTILPIADINVVEAITCIDSLALLNVGNSSSGTGITYLWFGQGVTGMSTPSVEPASPGQFILSVLNEMTGCEASDTVSLVLPQVPQDMVALIDIPICAGDASGAITVSNVTGGTPVYMYSINGDPLQTSPLFEDLTAGSYSLTVVDANGCSYAETFTITDGLVLTIDIGPDIEAELGDDITLWADVNFPWSQIDSIVWTPGGVLSCTHCFNPELEALQNTTITATVYTSGCEATDALLLLVDVNADIYIPNVFSPNDDGINDHVTVFTDDRVRRIVYLEIFDRWGNQVFVGEDFMPNDPLLGWDGSFKGKKMNPAVFAYIAKVELINGEEMTRKGDITLLR